jgi:lipoprotein-anchoring transpeptidase ErfK/SrfK
MQQGRINSGNGKQAPGPTRSRKTKRPKRRSPILPILLIIMGCVVFTFAAWSAITSPVLASILSVSSAAHTQSTHSQSFAQVNIAKPSVIQPTAQGILPTSIPEATATQGTLPEVVSVPPTNPPAVEAFVLPENPTDNESFASPDPTEPPYVEPATSVSVPEVTNEPGMVYAEIISDTPTPEYTAPTVAPYVAPQAVSSGGERWIDVDLSQQRVYAYEGDTLMNSFIVSTGTWQTPTVTGKFRIWIKVLSQAMSGPGYYLPDVPYVMYFYKDYGLHGTYWHNNFGTPMSHGCVNLTIPDSEWLYNFASVGTVVNVHY